MVFGAVAAGCSAKAAPRMPAAMERRFATTQGLTARVVLRAVEAQVDPPEGWKAQPLRSSARHTHQIWLSPSGSTAYGIIRFDLPLPVGPDIVLWYFMREMRHSHPDAVVIDKRVDPVFDGIYFIADGG